MTPRWAMEISLYTAMSYVVSCKRRFRKPCDMFIRKFCETVNESFSINLKFKHVHKRVNFFWRLVEIIVLNGIIAILTHVIIIYSKHASH